MGRRIGKVSAPVYRAAGCLSGSSGGGKRDGADRQSGAPAREGTVTSLGSGLTGPDHVQAGVGRLERAFHHADWTAKVIEEVMWEEAEKTVKAMQARGITPIVIMDSSCWEKSESRTIVGQSAVRSSQGCRLTQYRSHIYHPITVPIRVPGYEWECLLLLDEQGQPPTVATRWWARDKGVRGQQQQHQVELMEQARWRLGKGGGYVFDRGYGHGPWLGVLWRAGSRFVVRWNLRWALSALWSRYPPRFSACSPYRSPTHITWPIGSLTWWMTLWNRLDFVVEQGC